MTQSSPKPGAIRKYARRLAQHHFPGKKITLKELGGGLTNHVFEASAGRNQVVIRIAEEAGKINTFYKEQWAVSKARQAKIPVPDILEVGNDIIPYPYMISHKLKGTSAVHHQARLDILEEAGRLAALIHQVRTEAYGQSFNWNRNALSKKNSWIDYLEQEFKATERLHFLKKNRYISSALATSVARGIRQVKGWRDKPCLQHGDLRLKNIMVDEAGRILAIIDWEESISSIGPYWDLSIALHDLSVDAQQRFLKGYGLKGNELARKAFAFKLFNILNYSPVMEDLARSRKRNQDIIEHYKNRLHGVFDLFSL